MTPLKAAFQQSRQQKNIDLVLPVWRGTLLYLVVGEERPKGQRPDFFVTSGPHPERMCVTVADRPELLAAISWPKQKITGAELLAVLPPQLEIVVVQDDGADYLGREQLDWYRQQP